MASDPDHADCLAALRAPAQFDYAQLERRIWEEVEKDIDTAFGRGSGMYIAVIANIRAYAFAYRLSKTDATTPDEQRDTLKGILTALAQMMTERKA